jgi:hypothetical protein
MNQVLALWAERLVVAHQGVYYRNGSARALVVTDSVTGGGVSFGEPIDVDAVLAADAEYTTSVDAVLVEAVLPGSGRVLQGGECDHGSEGYFALLDPDRSLQWVAFFENSNPFVAITLDGSVATVRSSNGNAVSVRINTTDFAPTELES